LIDASGKESVKKKRRRVNGKAHPQWGSLEIRRWDLQHKWKEWPQNKKEQWW
jgi:hypothetical protein